MGPGDQDVEPDPLALPRLEAEGRARLDAHLAAFRQQVTAAVTDEQAGRAERAAVGAQIAGLVAWLNHPGMFASAELETLLQRLAGRIPPAPAAPLAPDAPVREVVHVVTQLYATGGHTQMIARWLDQDRGPRHRLVVTRQRTVPIPEKILGRLTRPEDLLALDRRRGGLITRAAALRTAVRDADVVVVHAHPYDVVPPIALSGQGHRVIVVNHADHVFWLGAGIASALLNLRESGRDLAVARRGIAADRCLVMARPLDAVPRSLSREEAKRRLGVPVDQVLVVTAADGSKYESFAGPGLLDLVVPVLREREKSLLLAAGPRPEGRWADAHEQTGGRVRALGRLPDVSLLHQAADLYLDSYPFASLTSMLESGICGNPLLTYRGHPDECLVLGADTPGLEELLLHPGDPRSFRAEFARLLDDGAYRSRLGAATRDAIAATHQGDGWRTAIHQAYDQVARLAEVPIVLGRTPRGTGPVDVLVERVQAQTPFAQGLPGALRENLGLLPPGRRVRVWGAGLATGNRLPLRLLLPEWLSTRGVHLVRRFR